jgi:hypothetical protein
MYDTTPLLRKLGESFVVLGRDCLFFFLSMTHGKNYLLVSFIWTISWILLNSGRMWVCRKAQGMLLKQSAVLF